MYLIIFLTLNVNVIKFAKNLQFYKNNAHSQMFHRLRFDAIT